MGFVRPSRALRTKWPHAADIRTRLGGTGEDRSDTTGFPIKKIAVPAPPELHSEAAGLLQSSIARDRA